MPVKAPSAAVLLRFIVVLVFASFSLAMGWGQGVTPHQRTPAPAPAAPTAVPKDRALAAVTPEALLSLNAALEGLSARVSQGVVQILVTGYGPIEDSGRTDTALIARQKAIGSGVIVEPSGYVVTNAHVIEGAQRIRVVLPVPASEGAVLEPEGKRRILDAKLVGVHQESDLALLKVTATDLPSLPLGTNRRVRQGQLVLAIGSPEGLQGTVTMGVVSSVARQPDPNKAMVYIQTDAPINPGNSGGPLVDMDGYVVGINTFIVSGSGGSEGLGFAIPARVVQFVYESLKKYGHVHRSEIEAGGTDHHAFACRGAESETKLGGVDFRCHSGRTSGSCRPEDWGRRARSR